MKYVILIIYFFTHISWLFAQQIVEGKVFSLKDGLPIDGASVSLQGTNLNAVTNSEGAFTMQVVGDSVVLIFSHLGYEPATITVKLPYRNAMEIVLSESSGLLDQIEVVSTGYQKIPKERATGSFATISKELFNQQIGTDILSRLPAIANSVVMDYSRSTTGQMMVRGLSTIDGPKAPLIIVDNFPYDGDLNNINPNFIENITILKDAAAASIWGARAANGVIVITTKQGQFVQPTTFEFNSNLTIGQKPNLKYIPEMSAASFIDIEQELFSRDFYKSKLSSKSKPVISPVVDMLDKVNKGVITQDEAEQAISKLRTLDVRDQYSQYVYKPSTHQQYFLSASGGSQKFSWVSSAGYDRNEQTLGDGYERVNVRFQNNYQPIANLSINANLFYTQTENTSGRSGYNDVINVVPYTQIADQNGNPLSVPRNYNQSFIETAGDGKLLDWNYFPLTDWKHQQSTATTSDMLGTLALHYQVISGLTASVNYQYERQNELSNNLADKDSYMARDYVNRFSQIINDDVVFIVPRGGILDKSNQLLEANNLRGQLSFEKVYGKNHLSAIAGGEARSANRKTHRERFYGFDQFNLTTGNVDYTQTYPNFIHGGKDFIANNQYLGEADTRFVSQFANAAYTFDNRYLFSLSARRDASNLFGLKTNDQWNPFWSAGAAWKLSNEKFYVSSFLPYLNLRATYGFSGNVDPAMVAVNTIRFLSPSIFTASASARFENYYNPNLRWETSKMFNIAADFRFKNNRLSGSVEYFHKNGQNLFGAAPLDYTTGVSRSMLRNVANMKGKGWDIELKSLTMDGSMKWTTILNFSAYKDQIVEYLLTRSLAQQYVNVYGSPISGIKGKPVYAVYAYQWAGLDPNTGEAQGYLDGEISKDYSSITGTGTAVEDLEYYGSAIPTKFGSLINSFSYKDFSLDMGITYKLGYWFRRNSVNYTNLFNKWEGHSDYEIRWQSPGDEKFTDVPVNQFTTNSSRDRFYEGAGVLVEKGDHIRLQYINLGYDFKNIKKINGLKLYLNVQNVGIIWKANKSKIDPDFNLGTGQIVTPIRYSFGIRAKF